MRNRDGAYHTRRAATNAPAGPAAMRTPLPTSPLPGGRSNGWSRGMERRRPLRSPSSLSPLQGEGRGGGHAVPHLGNLPGAVKSGFSILARRGRDATGSPLPEAARTTTRERAGARLRPVHRMTEPGHPISTVWGRYGMATAPGRSGHKAATARIAFDIMPKRPRSPSRYTPYGADPQLHSRGCSSSRRGRSRSDSRRLVAAGSCADRAGDCNRVHQHRSMGMPSKTLSTDTRTQFPRRAWAASRRSHGSRCSHVRWAAYSAWS